MTVTGKVQTFIMHRVVEERTGLQRVEACPAPFGLVQPGERLRSYRIQALEETHA